MSKPERAVRGDELIKTRSRIQRSGNPICCFWPHLLKHPLDGFELPVVSSEIRSAENILRCYIIRRRFRCCDGLEMRCIRELPRMLCLDLTGDFLLPL